MNSTLDNPKSIKLILHPGHGKCGSSSIQSFLYSNINELKNLNIYVPDRNFRFFFETQKSSLELYAPVLYFKKLIDENNIASFERRLNEVLEQARESNCKGIIISAENLGNGRGISQGRKIHEILASRFDQKIIIFYIRRQDDYLVSSWQQWGHKRGETLKEHIDQALTKHNPDFLRIAKFFEEVYGEDSVTVVPLHRRAFVRGSLIADFCYRSQLSISEQSDLEIKANKSLNPYLCDIFSRISSIYEDPHDNSVKKLLMSYVDTKEILLNNDKKILNKEQKNQILNEFKQDNHILNKKYFDYLPYNEFINEKTDVEDELSKNLDYDIERLKDIISIQMEIIIKLLKEQEKRRKYRFGGIRTKILNLSLLKRIIFNKF